MVKRNYQIKFRMNQTEYDAFKKKVQTSGQTQQAYLLNAIENSVIASGEEVEKLKELNRQFADQMRQIRGMATNINQMAHLANATGRIAEVKALNHMAIGIQGMRKECEELWQSIRQLISRQRPTGR